MTSTPTDKSLATPAIAGKVQEFRSGLIKRDNY